ncbi:MAG: M14 family metallopeptidase [Phycisphaerales bacterium]|nr:M14 family metallopeptidase [Phycisphaerales bacterium]
MGLVTVAERSDYRATARHAKVVELLDQLAAASPLARRSSLGLSGEGREIPLLILADPPVATAAEARARAAEGALVVLAIGNIHAGEVDGKEALPMLAREILSERRPALLRDLVLVIAPIYNADGNEQVSKDNRPGQNGPEEGMGRRENAAGLDLNRDGIKAEAAETAGLLKFFNEWDPDLFIDTHTTNGSYHRYILTYSGVKSPAGDAAMLEHTRERMMPEIAAAFRARTGWESFWYGNFEGEFGDAQRGHSRWESFPAEGRFLTTYAGLRGTFSLLTEAYSYAPFRDRVVATKEFVRCALECAAANRREIRRLIEEAEQQARRGAGGAVAIRSKMVARDGKFTLLGYEEETVDGRSRSTGVIKDYQVELWDRFIAEKEVARPQAYAIRPDPARSAETAAVIAKLRQHGIRVEQLAAERRVRAEVYTIRSAQSASRKFQNHVLVRVRADAARREEVLPGGTWIIPTGQPLGRLAVYLLEPESEDGLAVWNYFDPWLTVGGEFPVYRVMEEVGGAAGS